MHADTEQQQHNADFRQLVGQQGVAGETRCEWPDNDAREQVASQRGQTNPRRA